MRKLRILGPILVAMVVAGCMGGGKKKPAAQQAAGSGSGTDPWAQGGSGAASTSGSADGSDDDSGGGALASFGGIEKILETVGENLSKPGPYEAPNEGPAYKDKTPHWGVMSVSGGIVERAPFFGGDGGTELRAWQLRLTELAADANLTGLVLRINAPSMSLADLTELRRGFAAFRTAGKKLVCHAEGLSNVGYLVATSCERIGLAPLGEVMIPGPAAMPIHIKGLLDKFDVRADFVHVGAFKGAAEPMTRTAPSPEMVETMGAILDRSYESMIDVIAAGRGLGRPEVVAAIDQAFWRDQAAQQGKLVDEVATWEAFRDTHTQGAWKVLELEAEPSQMQAMVKMMQFIGVMPTARPSGAHVAVVYALGNIIDGAGGGVLGARDEIASHTTVAALARLAEDDNVKAVVLRIDSGGGSALASEQIWHAVTALKAKKPVVVSMSDVAASGGYYIAAGATKIFAQPDTLTGSIGVVGGKIAPGRALANVGVTTFPMGRGKRATMFASLDPWSADERATVQAMMDSVYEVFLARVAAGRGKSRDAIHAIAQGRVWTGTDAMKHGLIDAFGGLDDAIAEAQTLGKVDVTASLEIFPSTPTLRDVLNGFDGDSGPLGLQVDAALAPWLRALPAATHAATRDLLGVAWSFTHTPVQTLSLMPRVTL